MKRNLGQVFLIDNNIIRKIVEYSDLYEGEWVLEVGPGRGNLTRFLLEAGARVIAYEPDKKLVSELKWRFALLVGDRLFIKPEDFRNVEMERDIEELGVKIPLKFVCHIPYYITGLILRHLVAKKNFYQRIVLTLQKEVADRLVAVPGKTSYGFTSLLMNYHFEIKLLFYISPTCFRPVPKVHSATCLLIPRKRPPVEVKDEKLMFKVSKVSFNARRKKLRTILRSLFGRDAVEIIDKRVDGFSLDDRPERLSLADFARLSNEISTILEERRTISEGDR